ncbi:MAG TPA: hypothetical protein PKH31_06710, partial [Candidatus Sumerlaeota bacterium]|nr:hypothetical protein [Candidatus Sumerlaeota bacterium]
WGDAPGWYKTRLWRLPTALNHVSGNHPSGVFKVFEFQGIMVSTAVSRLKRLSFGFSFRRARTPALHETPVIWERKNAHFQGENAVPGTANLPIGAVKRLHPKGEEAQTVFSPESKDKRLVSILNCGFQG